MGVQRTYLDGPCKADVDPVRKSLGNLVRGAVRLAEPEAGRLLVGEGIETVAAAMRLFGLPGWATLGRSGLEAVELPDEVEEVMIAADRDLNGAGQRAAAALVKRLEGDGRHVDIRVPPEVDLDFADVLMQIRS